MTPFVSEIIGTFLLILMGCGVNANVVLQKTYGNSSGWIVITTGWGLAVYTAVVVAGPYSGAHLNPAVTIGLALAGEFSIYDVPQYLIAQMLGAMLGAFFVWLMHKKHFDATEDGDSKRAVFCTAPAIPNRFLNILGELLGTFVLVFAVLYFTDATNGNDNSIIGLGSLGALPVALIVWGIGLSLGGTTGYAINPARDLGPRIVHTLVPLKNKGSNGWSYSWVPILGPTLGAAIAAYLSLWLQ
ncbi:MIP/aquaporin family protein [Flagellimonas allohymeniacidonis]|uniref:Aquaporin family protein n=1 Tax=Flagellimonas allohymeniacidonis TaxID=2517819 RepID=A0A4Q8QHR4_9FLAO|nr:MIP/aquaporin family protein [Allomuricauda hymeniacidonis]TAI47989.1 aquaporin family protein [Allomuricauda hymeniacidonis]